MPVPLVVAVLVAQESLPIEGLAQGGVLGVLVGMLSWLVWQFIKRLMADVDRLNALLLAERADAEAKLNAERAAHNTTREQTAVMLGAATAALERQNRRRSG